MAANIEIVNYVILKLSVESGAGGSPALSAPEIDILQTFNPDNPVNRAVQLSVSVKPAGTEDGYTISARILGFFDVTGDETPERLGGIAAINGATILYGVLRAEIASITGNFPGGRAILPTVYMQQVLAAKYANAPLPAAAVAAEPAPPPPKPRKARTVSE